MKDDHFILTSHFMGKLESNFKKRKYEIQDVTKLTGDVVEKFTIIPAKEVVGINEFIQQRKP